MRKNRQFKPNKVEAEISTNGFMGFVCQLSLGAYQDEQLIDAIAVAASKRNRLFTQEDRELLAELEGSRFFEVQTILCEVIPLLQTAPSELTELVQFLVEAGGADLAANQPNAALRKWCEVDPRRSDEVIQLAKDGNELARLHLVFALQAKADFDEAIACLDRSEEEQTAGVLALSRMQLNADQVLAALEQTIALALAADIKTSCGITRAIYDIVAKDKDVDRSLLLPVLDKLFASSDDHVIHLAASLLNWHQVEMSEDETGKCLRHRCCELALLYSWDVLNRSASSKKKERKARSEIVDHVLSLYLSIGQKLIVEKIGPHADKKHAISSAVRSGSELDINLALFEAMGRSALLGLWHHFIGVKSDGKQREQHLRLRDQCQNIAVSLINQNPTLTTPLRDDHHIEIGLLMLLAQGGGDVPNVSGYLVEIASRLNYRYRLRKSWPTHFQDYRELARHPVDLSDEYFKKSTKGSVLVPFLKVSLERIQEIEQLAALEKTIAEELPDMTQQVWVPRDGSEEFFWRQGTSQGIAIPVPMMELEGQSRSLGSQIDEIVDNFKALNEMSAIQQGLVPLLLMACRHHRLPLPPHLWFQAESATEGENEKEPQE